MKVDGEALPKLQYGSTGEHCPVCGRRILRDGYVYCSTRCLVKDKKEQSATSGRDLAILMQQYKEGKWTAVD
jgi:predicted nucleic acid-binding Zn ribbon protein